LTRFRGPLAFCLLAAAALALLAGGADARDPRRTRVVEAVETASPAVVNISTEQVIEHRSPFGNDRFADEFFRDFFGAPPPSQQRRTTSLGSGVIVDAGGTILTNSHVILRGGRIRVTLADGRDFEARLIGADADTDIAVLRITTNDRLPYAHLGTATDLMIGETVIAIGNPFGLSHTVTTGVVSALGRALQTEDRVYSDFIQTDASINPGNSGGPLLNILGEVIAITTAIYGKAQGIGFAIPIDRARRVMRDLVSYGSVRRGWAGVVVEDLAPGRARQLGVSGGVVVANVEPQSPAARVALRRGMVITHVDGRVVGGRDEFEDFVESRGPGESLRLTVIDDGKTRNVDLTLATLGPERLEDFAWKGLGLRVAESDGGLHITAVRRDSSAAKVGIEPGDALLAVAGRQLTTMSGFREALVAAHSVRAVILTIGRGRFGYTVTLPVER
jgi:serine protease Do